MGAVGEGTLTGDAAFPQAEMEAWAAARSPPLTADGAAAGQVGKEG